MLALMCDRCGITNVNSFVKEKKTNKQKQTSNIFERERNYFDLEKLSSQTTII